MAAPENRTSKATHQSWITPGRALQIAKLHFQKEGIAADALGQRLRDGLLKAMAANVITQPRDEPEKASSYTTLSKLFWQHASGGWYGQSFWQTGNLEVWTDRGNTRCSVHGLRMDPKGVEDFLASLRDIEALPAANDPPLASDNRKSVSQEDLRVWAQTFLKLYGEDYTVKMSDASAVGMFPDKAVSRDLARKILKEARGTVPRTTGRKHNKSA
jgi:hypothetical protein